MAANVLILGYGNPGRGDDGLGPILVERLESESELETRPTGRSHLTLLTSMQLQPEHILDMSGHDLVILVDAGWQTHAPFTFERLQPLRDASYSTHALSPPTLLALYKGTLKHAPPPTFLLTICGHQFGLGEPLSPQANDHLKQAVTFVKGLVWIEDTRAAFSDR